MNLSTAKKGVILYCRHKGSGGAIFEVIKIAESPNGRLVYIRKTVTMAGQDMKSYHEWVDKADLDNWEVLDMAVPII